MAEILRIPDTIRIAAGRWFLILCIGGKMIAADDPEIRLEAAIHREIVMGDLQTAIEAYRQILVQPETPRAVAVRALFQTGQCYEKSGRRAQARQAYLRVTKEFNDQPAIAALARDRLNEIENTVPGPLNLKFDQGEPGKLPEAWFVPVLPKDANQMAQLRTDGCLSRNRCAVVLVPENAYGNVGNLMQSFSAAAYRGKTVRLRASLRLESAAPGDHAQMWLSVDRANDRRGFFDNMSGRPVVTAEWTHCEIQTQVDRDATFIKFGIMSIGRGRVFVDNVAFETISK